MNSLRSSSVCKTSRDPVKLAPTETIQQRACPSESVKILVSDLAKRQTRPSGNEKLKSAKWSPNLFAASLLTQSASNSKMYAIERCAIMLNKLTDDKERDKGVRVGCVANENNPREAQPEKQ